MIEVTQALKACPFCGHQRKYAHADAPCGDRRSWTVICEGCEAHGPPFSDCSGDEAHAIAAWNTRQPDPLVGELVSALRAIASEAERENGGWVHLKRCISVQCRQALAKWEARHA